MADASFKSAGYGLMIEDNPDQKKKVKAENVRHRGVWLERFLPTQDARILNRIFGNLLDIP